MLQENDGNDFEITAEELAGIEFIPTAQRMQTVSHGGMVKGKNAIKIIGQNFSEKEPSQIQKNDIPLGYNKTPKRYFRKKRKYAKINK